MAFPNGVFGRDFEKPLLELAATVLIHQTSSDILIRSKAGFHSLNRRFIVGKLRELCVRMPLEEHAGVLHSCTAAHPLVGRDSLIAIICKEEADNIRRVYGESMESL